LNGGDSDSDMCGYLAKTDLNAGPAVHVLLLSVPVMSVLVPPTMLTLLPLLLRPLQSPRSSSWSSSAILGDDGGDGGRCGCGLSYPQLAAPSD